VLVVGPDPTDDDAHALTERLGLPAGELRAHLPDYREIRAKVDAAGDDAGCTIVKTTSIDDMFSQLAALVANGETIDCLDILDHGAPGAMTIGRHILFRSDDQPSWKSALEGVERAIALGQLLSPSGTVRLLGCRTAVGTAGRMLLLKVREALGRFRTAQGTIERVLPFDFESDGTFGRGSEDTLLFSSAAALDGECPTPTDRDDHVIALAEPVKPKHHDDTLRAVKPRPPGDERGPIKPRARVSAHGSAQRKPMSKSK